MEIMSHAFRIKPKEKKGPLRNSKTRKKEETMNGARRLIKVDTDRIVD